MVGGGSCPGFLTRPLLPDETLPSSALCTSASNLPPTKGWPIRWPCHQEAVPDCRKTAGLHHFSWPPEPWKARGALFPFHVLMVTFYNAQDAALLVRPVLAGSPLSGLFPFL